MGIVPSTRIGKVEFYEAHVGPWTANAAGIGLLPASVTALATAVTAARAAYNAHIAAQAAAKAATNNFYDKVRSMHSAPGFGADMIQTIKAYAETKNDPNVYNLAQIPPPPVPGTVPPPGTPTDFTVALHQNGAVELKWKCENPEGSVGTIYEVRRRTGTSTTAPFVFVGAVGVRTFVDDTIPSGVSPVAYEITAVRSTSRGAPAQFTVTFGVGGGSGFVVSSAPEMKMAA
jgi:hypothetical protein